MIKHSNQHNHPITLAPCEYLSITPKAYWDRPEKFPDFVLAVFLEVKSWTEHEHIVNMLKSPQKKNMKKKTIDIRSFAAKFQFLTGSIAFYPQARELPPGRCCRGGQGKAGEKPGNRKAVKIHQNLSKKLWLPIGSMVLVYMLTWLGYIDWIHVTIYSSTMDPVGYDLWLTNL